MVFLTVLPPAWVAGQLGLLADRLLYPDAGRQPLEAPVFVVGNHRTGSTFLHRLLAEDDASFATFRLFELALPSVTQKRLVRTLGRVDAVIGGPGAALVRWLDARWATDYRQVHPMGIQLPEEDEYVLFFRCASGAMWETFPDVPRLRRHFWSDTEMDPAEQDALLGFYRDLAGRQRHHLGRGTWLSKNPLFSTRVRGLRRAFPDARFVYLVRDPRKVVASTASLLHAALDGVGALRSQAQLMEMVHEICTRMYDETLRHLEDLPPERLVVVRQEDLVADLEGTVRSMLAQLGLPWTPALQAAVDRAGRRQRGAGHRYALEDFGLTESDLRARYGDVMARFGYAQSVARGA
ncbi:MAG: sulfotransferase [Alphaproteobacteria bacterium]|nr:sulfotransferase [Alphaproteobacteria bacterium]